MATSEQLMVSGGGLIEAKQLDQIQMIDDTCRLAQQAIAKAEEAGNSTIKALLMARATRKLQELLTPDLMQDIMALQGSALGFKTDRDNAKDGPKGYPASVVRDVVIQALIRGFQVCGNQINIIGGNLYVTKEGFEDRLRGVEGLSWPAMDFEVPEYANNRALVGCRAEWRFNGVPDVLECRKTQQGDFRISCKVNAGMGDDAVLGKAKSKLLRKIFERVSGLEAESEADADDVVDAEDVVDAVSVSQPAIAVVDAAAELPPDSGVVGQEPIPAESLEEIQAGLAAINTRPQLEGFFHHWESKAKNRGWSAGQRETLIAHCRMKAEALG